MTQNEIRDFKEFMTDQDAYLVFEKTYNENRMSINPKNLEDYLELTRADIVIPQAFIYPETVYDKNFWLALHDKWKKRLNQKRAEHREAVQLEGLDPNKDYFQLGIEQLAETKDYLLFMLKKK